MAPLPCNEGPYIWDTSQHLEGIGSTFQWRKSSFIAANIINGKWIGTLTNEHHKDDGDQSSYFGLNYSHCDQNSLKYYKRLQSKNHVYVPTENMFNYISKLPITNVTKHTVLIFEWEMLDPAHNFVVFDYAFRKRFHRQRLYRNTPQRRYDEYWVSIHFRWGDVGTRDENKPNKRNGLGFLSYCSCISEILSINPNAIIFLFAELFTEPEVCKVLWSENVYFYSDSLEWKRDIDIMSQSQLLIGGSSSFFVLGAHLCENCTVIHSSGIKFAKSEYEKKLPTHLNDFNCDGVITCYLQQIDVHVLNGLKDNSRTS